MGYDNEKMNLLKKKRSKIYKEMWLEKDSLKKRKLQAEIKILDLKMAIEKMKQAK